MPEVALPLPSAPPLPDGPQAGVYSVNEALKGEMLLGQSFDNDRYRMRIWGKLFGEVMPTRADIPTTPQNIKETQEALSMYADKYFKSIYTSLQIEMKRGAKTFVLKWWPSKFKKGHSKTRDTKKCDLGNPLIDSSNTIMCGFVRYVQSDLTDGEFNQWLGALLIDFDKAQSQLGP